MDARGVDKIYQPRPPLGYFVALLLCILFPFAVVVAFSPIWRNMVDLARLWWRLHL